MIDKPVYDDDIILYTMEKVGTTTVLNTVKSAGIEIGRATIHNIHSFEHQYKRIITVVRDPIAWAISYYLEMPDAHPYDIKDPDNFGTLGNFHKNVSPLYPESWLIHKFREVIGVNILSHKFRKGRGYELLSLDRVLILLTHRLDDTLIPALSEFTGVPQSSFTQHPRENTSGATRFGEVYTYLHENVKYPRIWLLDNILESRYCKTFFFLDELKRMLEKWVR